MATMTLEMPITVSISDEQVKVAQEFLNLALKIRPDVIPVVIKCHDDEKGWYRVNLIFEVN